MGFIHQLIFTAFILTSSVACASVSQLPPIKNHGPTLSEKSAEKKLYVVPVILGNPTPTKQDGTKENPFYSIQKALDSASPGTTIYLKGGTYFETVNFNESGDEKEGPITLTSLPGEEAIIDGQKIAPVPFPQSETTALISIEDQSYITIDHLTLQNLSTTNSKNLIAGIFVRGSGEHINISNCQIRNIHTEAKPKGDAHGIAFYGTDEKDSLAQIEIAHNTLSHLKLGSSEALVVNGNVEQFIIRENTLHNLDNIAIDAIGHEGKASLPAVDIARDGLIENNFIYDVSSYGNPAYGKERSAGGIYIDGGKDIIVRKNKVIRSDIGIEVASEHAGKSTTHIEVIENVLAHNRLTGLAFGGYDIFRGKTDLCIFSKNILYQNDTALSGTGEVLMQFYTEKNRFFDNTIILNQQNIAVNNRDPSFNIENIFSNNIYNSPPKFLWKNIFYDNFELFQKETSQEIGSQIIEGLDIDLDL